MRLTKRDTAIHEAAHAVVAHYLGYSVRSIYLKADRRGHIKGAGVTRLESRASRHAEQRLDIRAIEAASAKQQVRVEQARGPRFERVDECEWGEVQRKGDHLEIIGSYGAVPRGAGRLQRFAIRVARISGRTA